MENSLSTKYDESLAVIVGINAYTHLQHLHGAVNDASAVAELLFNRFAFDRQNVSILLDQEATQQNICDRLEIVSQRAQSDDRVFFFFAGHGMTRKAVSGAEIGYVATVESEPDNWSTCLRIEDITRYSNLIAAKHILYVFDSCFSGLALTTRQADIIIQGVSVARWIADSMTHKARQVLTAGLAEQRVGDLTEDGHSIFTSYFLKALSGDAEGSEGEITASQAMAHVTDRVMKHSRSMQTPSHGDLIGSEPGGDFVFQHPRSTLFEVPAEREGGINTGILVSPGQKISFTASGVITYDSGYHFANPDGMLCTYKGQPLAHPQVFVPVVFPHPEAYITDNNERGIIGSLIGWIDKYSTGSAFLIGDEKEIIADREGYLYLAINDAKGTYADNQGEYRVAVSVQ